MDATSSHTHNLYEQYGEFTVWSAHYHALIFHGLFYKENWTHFFHVSMIYSNICGSLRELKMAVETLAVRDLPSLLVLPNVLLQCTNTKMVIRRSFLLLIQQHTKERLTLIASIYKMYSLSGSIILESCCFN